ncbi:ISAs1 family transposase [Salinivibrio kushneri]|uniref:ISAs1 family transposase n=1 Tax=Salinivibrio kushneri TaxID=1908198 RepID=UPI000988A6AA|nr:ISAs1 family transposase [Salinivibrio kushneri]OOE33498.1 ISAs1 family transposase [Salinivibrio kushneri]OOE37833.1 ISAs1 family transposase [Salinivibrio kushneri]
MTEDKSPFMHFVSIRDIRQEGKVENMLSDIILITICAVLSGHDTWKGIIDYGRKQRDFLLRFGFSGKTSPSADTIERVMGTMSTKALQNAFIEWMKSCHELIDGEVIAIDGKTLKGSYNRATDQAAIHMVNAFATANVVCHGQSKVDSKTNEITAIPKLLEFLDISGCLITIDAMGCQRKIAQKIIDKNADYLLAVKGNQGRLDEAFDNYYRPSMLQHFDGDSYSSQEKSHGRLETRCALINTDLSVLGDLAYDWPELKRMGIMVSVRQEGKHAEESDISVRYYISSKALTAKELHDATRSHWLIESMHWKLDVGLKEDTCLIRVDDRAEVFARIRQMVLNLLKQEKSFKAGIQRQRMMCAMDQEYLATVLGSLS